MIAALARWVSVAIQPRQRPRTPGLKDVMVMRRQLKQTIDDCMSVPAHRLRLRIERARTPQELWMLRNDAYQLIAQRHDQRTAARRIDALVQCFERWLDPQQLARVR